jgi:hypothetical protein
MQKLGHTAHQQAAYHGDRQGDQIYRHKKGPLLLWICAYHAAVLYLCKIPKTRAIPNKIQFFQSFCFGDFEGSFHSSFTSWV